MRRTFPNAIIEKFNKIHFFQKTTPFPNTSYELIYLAFNLKFIQPNMHVVNMKLFQNPCIYYLTSLWKRRHNSYKLVFLIYKALIEDVRKFSV